MAPYRDQKRPARRAPEAGLVTDMVRQFADVYASLRELIQNGLDAGASRIDVYVSHEGKNLVTAVHDDGCGMTQDTIEGPLLTLFASSKEADGKSIGKYGVGLMSVFALDPDEVLIETWREEGSYLLRLFRDHSYVLEAASPRPDSGTSVSIVSPAEAEAYAGHVDRCRDALRSWCRHARCPIHLVVTAGPGVAGGRERIDEPFALTAPVTVQHIEGDEHVVVGYTAGTDHLLHERVPDEGQGFFAGFYNRGLTLYETTEPWRGLDGLRFKAQSPALSHTLSRDNVRRDDAFERVMSRVLDLSKEHLPLELARTQSECATRLAAGREVPQADALLLAGVQHLDAQRLMLPLWHPVGGAVTASLAELADGDRTAIAYATEADALTEALAQTGVPVVRCSPSFHAGLTPGILRSSIQKKCGRACVVAGEHFALAVPHEAGDAQLLLAELDAALSAAGAEVANVGLCTTFGLSLGRMALSMPVEAEGPTVVTPADLQRWAKRWGAHRRAIWVDQGAPGFDVVLAKAHRDVVTAATLLARYVILETKGHIDDDDSDALLEHTLLRGLEAGP